MNILVILGLIENRCKTALCLTFCVYISVFFVDGLKTQLDTAGCVALGKSKYKSIQLGVIFRKYK